jgi:DNA-binding XRE family transcriptional regulator
MRTNRPLQEKELAALAKKFRAAADKSKADAARELGVAAPSIFNAEENPDVSLTKLRMRLIEAYSPFKVVGPVFYLKRK